MKIHIDQESKIYINTFIIIQWKEIMMNLPAISTKLVQGAAIDCTGLYNICYRMFTRIYHLDFIAFKCSCVYFKMNSRLIT